MFSLFASKTPKPFKPVLAPHPPRASCSLECNNQQRSPFFKTLPPEIRNKIYKYTFTGETRELLSVEAHPLSMLLTCHKVYHEATNLAFSRHTFPIADSVDGAVFLSLRNATAHLASQQVDAITTLSYDQRRKYIQRDVRGTARILTNAILLFPNLEQFEIRNLRSHDAASVHGFPIRSWYHDKRFSAITKYAPYWFIALLSYTIDGHAYSWQSVERWITEWPQLEENNNHLQFLEGTDAHGDTLYTSHMSSDAVGSIRGVQMCPCPCGRVEWSSVDLVQEGGRKIAINFVYHGPEDRPIPKLDEDMQLKTRLGPKAIILKEGAAPMALTEDVHKHSSTAFSSTTSVCYDVNEEYWNDLRASNGDLAAIFRKGWRTLTQSMEVDKLPGSKSVGAGDWARIKEMSEKDDRGASR